jgi:predicted metal-dependent phosphoesterase TrpH
MNNFRADLHCHTNCSDGTDSPERIIEHAITLGLSGLSITDHDTIEAYKTAMPRSKEKSFSLLSGIEFSASHRQESVHILGYAFPLDSFHINDFCLRHASRRTKRNQKILHNLKKLGISVTEEELKSFQSTTIGRPHIALMLIQKGFVTSMKEAFQKYLGEGKPAYDSGEKISVEETIDCIHQAGGFAILAHPQLLQRSTTIRDLLAMPLDGLEGYYAKIPLEQELEWINIAKKKNWLITGGSDYHGNVKPQNPLGSSWVQQETFEYLYERFRLNSHSKSP